MPEEANPKLYTGALDRPTSVHFSELKYAELDVTTNFSFLRGASHPDELVYTAALLGYHALAITDVNSLAGAVRAYAAAKDVTGFKLIVGARLVFSDGSPDLLAWCPDRMAYGNLCRLLTIGKRRAPKGECHLTIDDFLDHDDDLLVGVIPPAEAIFAKEEEAAKDGNQQPRWIKEGLSRRRPARDRFESHLHDLRDALGDRLSLVAAPFLHSADDNTKLHILQDMSRRCRVPLVATNHVHYHDAGRRRLQDVLTCIRHGCVIEDAGHRLFSNGERYLKSPAEMHESFGGHRHAIERGIEIADRCTFDMGTLKYEYPEELVPPGKTNAQHLEDLTWAGADRRYPEGIPQKVRTLLRKELALIEKLQYEPYFLTIHDIVRHARELDILCQGRGSAANSAVCYCLEITAVDPNLHDLLFARFLSEARNEPPDIDVDFEHERREEVIQYIYQKYGRDRAGMTATTITYRGRSAVRDVGKALGLPLDRVDSMAKRLDWWDRGTLNHGQLRECGIDPADPGVRNLIDLTGQLLGFPRHLSQHTGGMVMTRGPLCELVPIENAAMEDRTVIEWDKEGIAALEILKVDVLALGMLTALSKALKLLNERHEGTDFGELSRAEALRHEGQQLQTTWEGSGHGSNPDTSGSHCMAEGEGVVQEGIRLNQADAGGRKIRFDESDAAGGGIGAVEHCGGVRAGESTGLPEAPAHLARLAGGTVNAVGDRDRVGNAAGEPGDRRPARGDGPRASGPDSGRAEFQDTQTELEGTSPPSCLRASARLSSPKSVPSCLPPFQLHTLPFEDPETYEMMCDADTIGVFQIESRAQMSMLPRLQPRKFYDIVIEVAIVRPGPIQGNMVHPYLRRRSGLEKIEYPSDELREVLKNTMGVPLFQEQAMKVVMVAASFTDAEADELRKAMAAWRKSTALTKFKDEIISRMEKNGYSTKFAEQVFEQISGFGEYGFPESHAASFAKLVYASAWIKRHHPAVFLCAMLNSQPMGFYQPAQLVRDAREHGVVVLPVDVNFSNWDCTCDAHARSPEHEGEADEVSPKQEWGLLGPAVRLGFRQVKGMREDHANRLAAARERGGPFASVAQLHQRTRLPVSTLRRLAESDAFGSLGLTRRRAVWEVLELKDDAAPLFEERHEGTEARRHEGSEEGISSPPSCLRASVPPCLPFNIPLPPMPLGQEVMTDYATAGLSLKRHPVALVRGALNERKILTCARVLELEHGTWVKVAGLVLIRQRPGTAAGVVFETLEDETGVVNLILWPKIYDQFRPAARYSSLLQADGYVQKQGKVIHVLAKRLFDLSGLLAGLEQRSRDFH